MEENCRCLAHLELTKLNTLLLYYYGWPLILHHVHNYILYYDLIYSGNPTSMIQPQDEEIIVQQALCCLLAGNRIHRIDLIVPLVPSRHFLLKLLGAIRNDDIILRFVIRYQIYCWKTIKDCLLINNRVRQLVLCNHDTSFVSLKMDMDNFLFLTRYDKVLEFRGVIMKCVFSIPNVLVRFGRRFFEQCQRIYAHL